MAATITNEMIQYAQENQKNYGIPASLTLAQIMLESSGSNPGGLSKLAYGYNNFFGIKATPSNQYQAGTVVMSNKAGNDTGTYATFNSMQDSFKEYARILSLDRYRSLVTTGDYKDWANVLVKGGYAEDQSYANKVIKVIEDNGLAKYDSGYTGGGAVSSGSDSSDTTNIFGDIAVIVIIVVLIIGGLLLFIGAFTNKNPVSEATKTVKTVKKKIKGGKK